MAEIEKKNEIKKKNNLDDVLGSLIKGAENFMTSKTVVGESITVGDTVIIPLMDVTFGVGAGVSRQNGADKGSGGMGGHISPNAVLVVNKNSTRLVSVKNMDAMNKILDMIPDLVSRFTVPKDKKDELERKERIEPEEAVAIAFPDEDAQV